MITAYDWISLALFAAIVTAFIHETRRDGAPGLARLAQFILSSLGCAVVNSLGNQGQQLAALSLTALIGVFMLYTIRVQARSTD